MNTAAGHRLGKGAPRAAPFAHVMAAHQFLSAIPAAPETQDWTKAMAFPAGLMRNGDLSDCTGAAVGHIIQAWSSNNGQEVTPSDDDVVKFYSGSTGYVPGDASTDQGGIEAVVLAYAKSVGLAGMKIDGFAQAQAKNLGQLRQIVNTFGGAYIGLDLPRTIESQGENDGATWDVDITKGTDAEPGSLGGHAVVLEAYDAGGFVCVTWGVRVYLTNNFLTAYNDEAWALLANGIWAPKGVTPAGDPVPAYDGYLRAVA